MFVKPTLANKRSFASIPKSSTNALPLGNVRIREWPQPQRTANAIAHVKFKRQFIPRSSATTPAHLFLRLLLHKRREQINRNRQERGRVVLAGNLAHGL